MQEKALLIDHDDSFIWNIKAWLSPKFDVHIINHKDHEDILKHKAQKNFNLIILSPGPKSPKDYVFSMQLLKDIPPDQPVLGICLGFQMMAEHFNQNTVLAPTPIHGKTSLLKMTPNFATHNYWAQFENQTVARYHSLATNPHSELAVLATSQNDGCIMWAQALSKKWMGFQFHPESFLTTESSRFLDAVTYWMKN